MTRSAQRAARWSRLLLLGALLLGIVTMHTLGHPSESHAMEDVPAAHSVAREHTIAAQRPAPVHALPHAAQPAHAAHVTAGAPVTAVAPAVHAPVGPAMDPMSVCLAVLAGLVLLALGRALVRYDGDRATGGRVPGAVPGGPDPPGPRELLTRLAVLRV
ncbi:MULTISPECIES: hypothetical protein [unclassified Streptomyces]|uniref:hypothetical protein n=1 Tax=unclassified Streptomyces TaxID=2593676 RepID=UPI00224D98C0|nr:MULTISPECIES: hypothetical protein [unclassified Streptomyces]MCX4525593.1 hypothetical protein [Streptomyces sp. NBC_01551]MCX4543935.1 hypothetical protein [Streptomyces sp. NBC_01565]